MTNSFVRIAAAFALTCASFGGLAAQEEKPVDPMVLLSDMAQDIGGSPALSFDAVTLSDEQFENQFIKRIVRRSIAVARPSTLLMRAVSDDGETTLVEFNGERARVFYVADKEFADVEFKGDLDAFIDFADTQGLSRTAVLDLLSSRLDEQAAEAVLDTVLIEDYVDPLAPDAQVFNVLFKGVGANWQLWLQDGEDRVVPQRMVVTYLGELGQPEHATQFSNWQFDIPTEGLAQSFGIPGDLTGWTKVDFVSPTSAPAKQ
jgi:hypothetical protein